MKKISTLKGFTLIELLVVIAIIAVLAVVVVLTLNPAQLLAQSRDSNRISDMATMKSAIALYQADVTTTTLATPSRLYEGYLQAIGTSVTSTGSSSWNYNAVDITASPMVQFSSGRGVDGTGWIPVNFNLISSGAPFGSLPIDPDGATTLNTGCFGGQPCAYTFLSSATGTYKMAIKMESTKYNLGGGGDVVSTDGGTVNGSTTFEIGTNLAL